MKHGSRHRLLPLPACALALALPAMANDAADANMDAQELDRVSVHATRVDRVSAFDLPASVSVVVLSPEDARANALVSEPLAGVPGLLARDRQNHAQDTQLSIRGFGSRATFGVRGVRLYADGIPASMPDGQGQLSHFNLMGAERIEVLRGPFSALHGNSSGGVVQLWSADGRAGDTWRIRASAGSNATRALAAQLRGGGERSGYNVALSRFETDGFRDHSAARRDSINARVHFELGERRRLDLVFNHLDLPEAKDPLGLTWTQVLENPRQATSVAAPYDTRKSVRQSQAGMAYEHGLGTSHTLRVTAHAGQRAVEQYLALPIAAQTNPLNSGGVIDLDNDYAGIDLRWSWQGQLAGRDAELTAGVQQDRQNQHRLGFENFIGTETGIRGRLRRDERNRVRNHDVYAQAWWAFAERWSLLAGARRSDVSFDSRDHFIATGNPDDSGSVSFARTSPVAGVVFAASEHWRFHLSAGRGFETPTFNELAYRADGGAGLALDLLPATSDHVELGMKWRDLHGATLEAAVFRADTDDELAVARNVAGRSSFRNVGRARRQGIEMSWSRPLAAHWDLRLAGTWLDAVFRDDYLICSGAGCTVPATPIPAGTRIPGVARQQVFARLQWHNGDWGAALEGLGNGDVTVNDAASESAPGHVLLHLEGSRRWHRETGEWLGFVRIDNMLDKAHIGSVIVNEGNGRFYEPGPGRSFTVGLQWQWSR